METVVIAANRTRVEAVMVMLIISSYDMNYYLWIDSLSLEREREMLLLILVLLDVDRC